MTPASDETRQALIDDIREWRKQRMEFQAGVAEQFGWSARELSFYEQGMTMGLNIMLSLTDSRDGADAKFRLTDGAGNFIPFYPGNHPNGLEHDADGKAVYLVSLCSELYAQVNT
jgi:hypothetical protein